MLLRSGTGGKYRPMAGTITIDTCRPRPSFSKPAAGAAVDRRDRQTDGRTSDRYIYAYCLLCGQRQ